MTKASKEAAYIRGVNFLRRQRRFQKNIIQEIESGDLIRQHKSSIIQFRFTITSPFKEDIEGLIAYLNDANDIFFKELEQRNNDDKWMISGIFTEKMLMKDLTKEQYFYWNGYMNYFAIYYQCALEGFGLYISKDGYDPTGTDMPRVNPHSF